MARVFFKLLPVLVVKLRRRLSLPKCPLVSNDKGILYLVVYVCLWCLKWYKTWAAFHHVGSSWSFSNRNEEWCRDDIRLSKGTWWNLVDLYYQMVTNTDCLTVHTIFVRCEYNWNLSFNIWILQSHGIHSHLKRSIVCQSSRYDLVVYVLTPKFIWVYVCFD